MKNKLRNIYLRVIFFVLESFVSVISKWDKKLQKELSVLNSGWSFSLETLNDHKNKLNLIYNGKTFIPSKDKADLRFIFKHPKFTFWTMSFQENTFVSFSRERMIIEGDTDHALLIVRVLGRVQSILLPKMLSPLAVRKWDGVGIIKKITYFALVFFNLIKRIIFK